MLLHGIKQIAINLHGVTGAFLEHLISWITLDELCSGSQNDQPVGQVLNLLESKFKRGDLAPR